MAIHQLSSGTLDQLQLAIRLALVEKTLRDSQGFFVLDDLLIRLDYERLGKQLAMLIERSRAGWQFLYFTAKQEVPEVLNGDIRSGVVKLVKAN